MPILTAEDRIGTLFAGRYKMEGILGTGGTGVVYEASHFWTSRRVAVKLLKPHLAEDVSLVRRFLQEARSASEVAHANVIQVLDMGAEEDGCVFLVMERLEGQSLGARLDDAGTLELGEMLELLVPLMDALVIAHQQGIVHRDLKPENIYLHHDLRGRRVPKLLDFGMSKILDPTWGQATVTGTIVGTPYYMAPEQAEGAKDQGPACDVWSMGVVMFRCLSGRLPFTASSPPALLLALVRDTPPALRDVAPHVPEPIAEVIDRALTRDREARWADMGAFLDALREAAREAGLPFPALPSDEPPPAREAFDPGPRRDPRRALRWIAAASAAVLVGAGAYWAMSPDAAEGVANAQPAPPAVAAAPPVEAEPELPEAPLEEARPVEEPAEADPIEVAEPPAPEPPVEPPAARPPPAQPPPARTLPRGQRPRPPREAAAPEPPRPDTRSDGTIPGVSREW